MHNVGLVFGIPELDGSMQRLVSDSKFSKLMAQTRRLLSDSSGLLQSWTSLNQQGDNTIRSVLTMTLGLVKVIKVLSSRECILRGNKR